VVLAWLHLAPTLQARFRGREADLIAPDGLWLPYISFRQQYSDFRIVNWPVIPFGELVLAQIDETVTYQVEESARGNLTSLGFAGIGVNTSQRPDRFVQAGPVLACLFQ
jgi:hypothetical protein